VAWTTPATFTSGNILTALQLNTNLRDNTNFLNDPPAVLTTRQSNLNIATGTETSVAFNAADIYDTDTMHDPVTNNTRLTCNTAGVFFITGTIQFAPAATGQRHARVFLNATTELAGESLLSPDAGHPTRLTVSIQWKLAVTDFVELQVIQASGAGLSITGTQDASPGPGPCYFSANWIGGG
jgi:hypothetical protein